MAQAVIWIVHYRVTFFIMTISIFILRRNTVLFVCFFSTEHVFQISIVKPFSFGNRGQIFTTIYFFIRIVRQIFFYEGKVLLHYQFSITEKSKVYLMKFQETISFVIFFPTSTCRSSCLIFCLPFRKTGKTYIPEALVTKTRHSCTQGIYFAEFSKNSTTSST